MRRLLIVVIPLLSPCSGEPEAAQDAFVVETCAPLPGPERAKAAAERVRPGLARALAEKGLHFGDPVVLLVDLALRAATLGLIWLALLASTRLVRPWLRRAVDPTNLRTT